MQLGHKTYTAATAAFVVVATMHRRSPHAKDFGYEELMDLVDELDLGPNRGTIYQHISQHCVANVKACPNDHRMFFRPCRGRIRLLEPSDEIHPSRQGLIFPRSTDLSEDHQELLLWAKQRYELKRTAGYESDSTIPLTALDALLALYGSGKELWADEHADEYIARLREGWE